MSEEGYSVAKERVELNTPEKAFVREKWLNYAKSRKTKNQLSYVKLFTLPGEGCFDVVLLRKNALIKMQSETQYASEGLAFCEKNPERFARIRNRLPYARAFPGRYEDFIMTGQYNISGQANKWFPFDVINLDFSGPPLRGRLLDSALKTILVQGGFRHSFTMFLTFECKPDWDGQEAQESLKRGFEANLAKLNGFKAKFAVRHPAYPQTPLDHHDFLLLALPKFVLREGFSKGFEARCCERFTYVGSGMTTRMVSFVFEFEYMGPTSFDSTDYVRLMGTSYPAFVSELVEQDYADVNSIFQREADIKTRCEKIVVVNQNES